MRINLETKERSELLEAELSHIVYVLKKENQPEKIILFGSFANGRTHQWSDIDLVIIKDTKEHFIDRIHKVSLLTKPSVGVNFIVDTNHYFFIEEILKKGKILYERTK